MLYCQLLARKGVVLIVSVGFQLNSQLPEDIEWHFIGNLQSNKVKPLLGKFLFCFLDQLSTLLFYEMRHLVVFVQLVFLISRRWKVLMIRR